MLWNGLNLELWFEKFFQQLKGVPGVVVSQGIQPMGIVEGPYKNKPNLPVAVSAYWLKASWLGPEDTTPSRFAKQRNRRRSVQALEAVEALRAN